MARVLGRLRISKDTEASTAIERQREAIERWALMMGHVIVGWAIDRDVSGAVSPFDAPELGPWLNSRQAEWDILVSWKLDRLGRGLFDMADLFRYCEQNGKALACVADNIDISTAMGRFIATILAGVAEMEREAIRSRVLSRKEADRRNGAYTGGTPPYGYVPVKQDGRWMLVPDAAQRETVREIFTLATRQSVRSIARKLNERGIPAPKGGQWASGTLMGIIRSRSALGYVLHSDKLVIGEDGNPVRREPLVTQAEFDRANRAVVSGRPAPNRKHETALLSGRIRHGRCGQEMHSQRHNVKGKTYAYYRCSGVDDERGTPCSGHAVKMDDMDARAEFDLLTEIGSIERTETVRVAGGDEQVIADLSNRIRDLTATMAESDEDDDSLAEELSALKAQRKAERSKGDEYRRIGLGETWAEAWARMDNQERRSLLADSGITFEAVKLCPHEAWVRGLPISQTGPCDCPPRAGRALSVRADVNGKTLREAFAGHVGIHSFADTIAAARAARS